MDKQEFERRKAIAQATWRETAKELRLAAVVFAERVHLGRDAGKELAEYRAAREEWTAARNAWLDLAVPSGTAEATSSAVES